MINVENVIICTKYIYKYIVQYICSKNVLVLPNLLFPVFEYSPDSMGDHLFASA
jgi:hypothetical protein